MSLQKKTLLIIFITFLSLGFLGFISMRLTIFESYQNLEADNIKHHVQRIENSISHELHNMEKLAADWGHWTDSYDFILGNNPEYEEDNLDAATLVNLDLNLILLTDTESRAISLYQVDLLEEEAVEDINLFNQLKALYPELFHIRGNIDVSSGIIMMPDGPMLIASSCILKNDKSGPSAGKFVVGKYLDQNIISKISKIAKLSVKIHSLREEVASKEAQEAKLHLSQDTTKVSIPKNDKEISGFSLISDIRNNPALILEVTVKRDILAKAKQSFILFALIFFVVLLGVMLVTNNLLNKLIIGRMMQLSNQADQIALNRQFDRELQISGNDEISSLGKTFNLMLKSLQESYNQTKELNLKLEDRVVSRTIALKESNRKLLAEVEERSEVQRQLEVSLAEKVVLLKEVYHRVKNNLQVITSLLNLQAGQSDSEEVKLALQASRSRVHSMSLVHEQLYRNDSLRYIAIRKYLSSIVAHLFGLYSSGNRNVSFEVLSDDLNMTVDKVIPCGLIVTELVSNSLKYAFKGLEEGKVIVKLHKHDDMKATLEISDTGRCLPKDFDPANSKSLGLKLVDSLALQLGGKLITDQANSKFTITFKYSNGGE